MVQQKGRRYYKENEKVWVIGRKSFGTIKKLNVNPSEGIYKADVLLEGTSELLTLNLWEINKDKRLLFKKETRQQKRPTILFAKVRDTAKIPSKNVEDAGYDIYADFEEDCIVIEPNTVKMIPTGIASSVTDDWALIAKERGSTGTKGMSIRCGVIDSGYRGEIFIPINNTTKKAIVIAKESAVVNGSWTFYPYEKAIAQLLLVPVLKANVKEISYEDLKKIPSKRGTGALGSSNK